MMMMSFNYSTVGPAFLQQSDAMSVKEDGFSSTEELIRFVKHEFGHHFTIAVTGIPCSTMMVSSDMTLRRASDNGWLSDELSIPSF